MASAASWTAIAFSESPATTMCVNSWPASVSTHMSPTRGVPLNATVACVHSMFALVNTSVLVGNVPEVIDWSGVPTNR